MPILRIKEIINMSSEARTKKLSELRTELARMRTMINAGGAVENSSRVRDLRKTIAQILTVENEVKLNLRATTKEEQVADNKSKVKASKEKQD
ncbi:MAG: 50S ribosomal protein L29 [Candidatus Bathyarchaeota archaeon]|nr:50S ribosomal protein L29 [Candidatus Termiticorpusculum sp.]